VLQRYDRVLIHLYCLVAVEQSITYHGNKLIALIRAANLLEFLHWASNEIFLISLISLFLQIWITLVTVWVAKTKTRNPLFLLFFLRDTHFALLLVSLLLPNCLQPVSMSLPTTKADLVIMLKSRQFKNEQSSMVPILSLAIPNKTTFQNRIGLVS